MAEKAATQDSKQLRVGVLGGGQLGRMMAVAAHNLGSISVIPLDGGGIASPAGQVAGCGVKGSFKDAQAVKRLAEECDVITAEIEHVNCGALKELVAAGGIVRPSPECIETIQDKFLQKQHFEQHNIQLPPFRIVSGKEDLGAVGEWAGYPYMLKSRLGAYDGKGNAVVRSCEEAEGAFESLAGVAGDGGCYAEKWCPFTKELAVMVVCMLDKTVMTYPVVEFTSRDNVCHTTYCPARIDAKQRKLAEDIGAMAVASLPGACGVFGVELFALADGSVLLNEVAPRPHNSGHYTIEACHCSQFESHLRAVAGLPAPGDVSHRVGVSMMVNVLGKSTSMSNTRREFARLAAVPGGSPHWYGKNSSRPGRKMGHVTICASSESDLYDRLAPVVDLIGEDALPSSNGSPLVGVIMGSDSDLPCMQAACEILDKFSIQYEVTIVSAHRTPDRMFEYAKSAVDRGLSCIIAGAGGAAHLPGMVAALTSLPVIGVPVKTSALSGVDSLYSIVQMPRGVPVATVAIGNAKNAGLLAVRMLAGCQHDQRLLHLLKDYSNEARKTQEERGKRLLSMGAEAYLAAKGGTQSKTVM